MQDKTQQELETLLDLFEHEGWNLFIEEKESLVNSLKQQAHLECNTNDEWQQRRGIIATLENIMSFETVTKFIYEQNQEEADVQVL